MKSETNPKDDRYVDIHYADNDGIEISGRVSRKANHVMTILIILFLLILVVGILLIPRTAGMILFLIGGIGVLFIAPLVASAFDH